MTPLELHQAVFLLGPWVRTTFARLRFHYSRLTTFKFVAHWCFLRHPSARGPVWPGTLLLLCTFALYVLKRRTLNQFVHYAQWYHDDKLGLKLAVVGLAIITTLKSIQALFVH